MNGGVLPDLSLPGLRVLERVVIAALALFTGAGAGPLPRRLAADPRRR